MKSRSLIAALTLSLSAVGCADTTGLDVVDLIGIWAASEYQFTDNANASNVIDIIQRDGATFTLTISGNRETSALFTDGMGNQSSDSGTLNQSGNLLTILGVGYTAVRAGDVLTLTHDDQQFDFGSGDTSATVFIVLDRQ